MPTSFQRGRAGFTLAEIMVAMTLLGIVVATILTVIVRQQRFYRSANEAIDVRSQIRQATTILPTDLRGLSSVGGDFTLVADSAAEFRANIGSAVICAIPNNTTVDIPPTNLAYNILTSWYTQPQPGDTMFIFDDGTEAGAIDDDWRPYTISAIATNTSTCPGGPFTDPTLDAAASKPRWRITISGGTLSPTILSGSVIRFARRVRYSLYRAPDNQWYLGFKEKQNNVWTTVQPVSGPYLPYAAGGTGGLNFQYYDTTGVAITTLARASDIARIDVRVRGRGQSSRNSVARFGGQFNDSLLVRVAVRNRT
jgi:prepilin-type N-terminal cleavage/methylation domain-containing protein